MKCEDVLVEKKAQAIECNGRSGFNSTQENDLCVKKKKKEKKKHLFVYVVKHMCGMLG